MAADPVGNLTVRIVDDIKTLADRAHPFRACLPVVALDLAGSLDTRERAAGLRALPTLIGRVVTRRVELATPRFGRNSDLLPRLDSNQ